MMYGWNYGQGGMMGSGGVWAVLLWLVVFIDLVLVGIWLFQKVTKKK